MKHRKSAKFSAVSVVAIIIVATYQYFQSDTARQPASDRDRVGWQQLDVPASWSAGQWITLEGTVTRILSDDHEGSRHQRFIISLADDRTLLVAHNIDLAKRVPLEIGDNVALHGRYETNNRGGVVHWTHRDPGGREKGGWIEFKGQRYR